MLDLERRRELASLLKPVSKPVEIDRPFTEEQKRRMLDVVHDKGEWKLILAQHFANVEELLATSAGSFPEGFVPSLDMFITPTFRGHYADYGTVLYRELHDVFYNAAFIEHAKA